MQFELHHYRDLFWISDSCQPVDVGESRQPVSSG
jgi:hypothetical protein